MPHRYVLAEEHRLKVETLRLKEHLTEDRSKRYSEIMPKGETQQLREQ